MPAWAIHLKIAGDLNRKLKLNEDLFYFGNIIADTQGWIVKDLSQNTTYEISHHGKMTDIKNVQFMLPNKEDFLDKHKNDMQNPLILGYFSHILADYFFNYNTFKNKYIFDNNEVVGTKLKNGDMYYTSDRNILKVYKQSDFKKISMKIVKSLDISINESSIDEIYKNCALAKEVPYNIEDVTKTVKYLNGMKEMYSQDDINNIEYRMYSENQLEIMIKDCTKYIEKQIIPYLNK